MKHSQVPHNKPVQPVNPFIVSMADKIVSVLSAEEIDLLVKCLKQASAEACKPAYESKQ